jgi:putative tricarboxylic transport membrane protein
MRTLDQVSGLFWLGLSGFVCLQSIKADVGSLGTPGPGFLPFTAAVLLGILTIALLVTDSFARKSDTTNAKLWEGIGWRKVVFVFVGLLMYAVLVETLGYLVTTFGLLFLLFEIGGIKRFWTKIVFSFISVLITYLLFYLWLMVPLPKGVMSF